MPVSGMSVGKCSDQAIDGKASRDKGIFVNVDVVIKIDEVVPKCLAKNQPRDCNQAEANQ
jgi:hypothetical protein